MSVGPIVSIIMGSESDLQIMEKAFEFLQKNGVLCEMKIISAHRSPDLMVKYAKDARSKGIKVIIAGAGGSAHLPGMVASLTTLPVIGVPIRSHNLNGLDSLLSIVQMPQGVPVACVAINGSVNAAVLACQILGINSKVVENKLENYRKSMYESVVEKSKEIGQNPVDQQ